MYAVPLFTYFLRFLPVNMHSYLVTDLMETDLQTLLKAKPIESEFVQFFLYQILRGLKYVHSAGVIHRNLRPSNILINGNCDLKICNFGLARVDEPGMTGDVATGHYTAPEVMLTWLEYDEKIDIWGAGCIFAEMLRGNPLFSGQNYIHRLHVITELLGTPPEELMTRDTLALVQSFPKSVAINLLERMLAFDPHERVAASEALTSPYIALYHDPSDEPEAERRFDWTSTGDDQTVDCWKANMFAEVLDYHKQAELQESVKQWIQSVSMANSETVKVR
ncbi:hypothetical protein PENFLA_c084G07900 [Penicillium flavigenum]|uniref:Protein kinase domain-containing protein n=1 Tax=Penicillium flavigenum TaxID=254877 RepID=A0A1V6S9C1_9EURO|nr:hypothetical protein PENFLA_c084G07900 [Penicillium flavigenum]